jgi:hypothetical protein
MRIPCIKEEEMMMMMMIIIIIITHFNEIKVLIYLLANLTSQSPIIQTAQIYNCSAKSLTRKKKQKKEKITQQD